MGLFFNYDKPGPGVDKNAPKRKGMFLFFDLLGRNFGKFILSNMLYFAMNLPISILYFMIVSCFLSVTMPGAVGTVGLTQIAIIITLLIVILWGTGPVSCGYTYILRNTAREEHTFWASDFFEKTREGFRHGLVFVIVDIVVLICLSTAIVVYLKFTASLGGIYIVLLSVTIAMIFIYTIMHFYLYEFEVTFDDKILSTYKNSFLMAFATMPMCLLIVAIICIISFVFLSFLTPVAEIFVALLCWISLMRFIVDFYIARTIKETILHKYEECNRDDN